jgi:hypothetical protein
MLNLIKTSLHKEKPVMVHGTSTYAIEKMFETGFLPTARIYEDQKNYENYLFFIPRLKSFKKHSLINEIESSSNIYDLRNMAKNYAEQNQQQDFLEDKLGKLPEGVDMEYLLKNKWLPLRLKRKKVDVNKLYSIGVDELYEEYQKQRGVLIGINEKIFELNIEEGKDDFQEICIKLPHGLDIKYVSFIYPYGRKEKATLGNWIKENYK